MHNPDPHALSAVITQLPRTVTYTHALERVQRALGTEPYRSPSAGAIYQALIAHGYTTTGRGEYVRQTPRA